MKKVFNLLLFLTAFAVHTWAQGEESSSILLRVDGNLPVTEDRNGKLKEKMSENAKILLDALNNALYSGEPPVIGSKIMTDVGQQELHTLWKNSQFYCEMSEVDAKLVKYSHLAIKDKKECAYEIEGIPVQMYEQEDGCPQALNILFNGQGKICGLTFSLNTNIVRNISDKEGTELDLNRQKIILRFLEEFRTAYNRKDLAFLEKVYSDDALIIVGRTIQKKDNNKIVLSNSDFKNVSQSNVEYLKTSKPVYLSRLKSVFNANEYINVDFENIKIIKHPNKSRRYENQYCVNLNQSWTSTKQNGTGYHDDGYLFLLVNFDDLDHPTIQIRTWQNMKDTAPEDKITIYNINL